jgi:peroxiredoxin Q/BCP
MRITAFLLALIVGLLAPAFAQQPPARIEVNRLGPQVGETVPEFRLQDAQGRVWTRESIMGPKGAMLVFSRSFDWCPYCKTQAIELQGRVEELKARGLGLAIITYDSPAVLADFSTRRGITYPLLADPGSSTIKTYGILNTTVAANTSNYGIPFPGTFMLDRSGKVTARFFEEAYQERNTVSTIMLATGAAQAPAAATRVQTNHLEVTSFVSDEVVAPGTLFSVVVDVKPNAGIHVYAPGANSYRIVNLQLDADPLLVKRALQYPASEIYHFKPLDERVPVYQKPFRLVQAMAVSASADVRPRLQGLTALTIKGTLEYQACDDRLCFTPQSIPVSFSVKLRQLDTQRANVPK